MKRLVVNLVAFLVIGMGGFYLTTEANATANESYGGGCLEMGCTGGYLDCYSPPGGGMCYTGGEDPTPEKEIS